VIIEACRCDDGFGVSHDHLVYGHTGLPFPEVRIWVDWKKVARALCLDDGPECGYCGWIGPMTGHDCQGVS
jgi:hypothetical protein